MLSHELYKIKLNWLLFTLMRQQTLQYKIDNKFIFIESGNQLQQLQLLIKQM